MPFIFLKVLAVRAKPILVEQEDSWQVVLGNIFQEILPFFNINVAAASSIENCCMVTETLIMK